MSDFDENADRHGGFGAPSREPGEKASSGAPVMLDRREVSFILGKIVAKLDSMEKRHDERHKELLEVTKEHGLRLDRLERLKNWIVSGASIGGTGGVLAWWEQFFGGR